MGRSGRALWVPTLVVVAVLVGGYTGRYALAAAWHWLGAWHWVVLLLLALLAAAGVVALVGAAPEPPSGGDDGVRRRLEEAEAAVEEERRGLSALTSHQFVLLVSRTLRRDGWADAHVETGDPSGTLVVAHRGATSLLVRCKHERSGRAVLGDVGEVADRAAAVPGAVAVVLSTGGFTHSAEVTGVRRGVALVDDEAVARWLAHGASAWPVPVPAAP